MSAQRIASLLAAAACLALPALARPIAIVGGDIWTGTSEGTISKGVVLVDNGRVVSVNPAGSPVPVDASIVDASGKSSFLDGAQFLIV